MNDIVIFWALLSSIPGAGFIVAGKELWAIRAQQGSLYPLLFCWLNGIYDIAFGVILLVGSIRKDGNNLDLIVIWAVLYTLARISSIGLALFLSGQADEDWLRKILAKVKVLFS